jgi:hypothetical protein
MESEHCQALEVLHFEILEEEFENELWWLNGL